MSEKSIFYWAKHWIHHPAYFVFCFAVGVCIWSFSFEAKNVTSTLQFSLQPNAANEMRLNEEKAISRLPATATQAPKTKLPKRFRSNPAFQVIEKLKEIVE